MNTSAPEEMGADVMVDFYERLLAEHETKDVEIEMLDGTIHAHSVVLCAASDAMRGMLRHGRAAAADPKRLSWREHPMEVGHFVLRLVYTGTVSEEEWIASHSTCDVGDVPLKLLLGALAVSMVYLVKHVLPALTQALQKRVTWETFDTICAAAIRLDATALRLHCLQYAHVNSRCLRNEAVRDGTLVRALRRIDAEYAEVPEGTIGVLQHVHEGEAEISWEPGEQGGPFTNSLSAVRGSVELYVPGRTMRDLYDAEELSPEVMSELAALWGSARPPGTRRRRRLL